MKRTRQVVLALLPWVILLGQLMPMTLFREPWHPWYITYTTVWGSIAAFVFYPATLLSVISHDQPIGGIWHWTANVVWAAALTLMLWKLSSPHPDYLKSQRIKSKEQNQRMQEIH